MSGSAAVIYIHTMFSLAILKIPLHFTVAILNSKHFIAVVILIFM